MYDPHVVLQALDAHKVGVIAFAGMSMVFNYIWFALAAKQGFKDKVFPVPLFTTLLWLCGDGTGVLRYDMYFNTYGHWYLELFWVALILTVSFEILFLYMTFKFGKKELLPNGSNRTFSLGLIVAAIVFAFAWAQVIRALPDDLNIVYFNFANIAGPIAWAAMIAKRRSIAGTNSTIWILYTLMLCCFYFAQASWFGPEFRTPFMLTYFVVNIAAAAGLAVYIRTQERARV